MVSTKPCLAQPTWRVHTSKSQLAGQPCYAGMACAVACAGMHVLYDK